MADVTKAGKTAIASRMWRARTALRAVAVGVGASYAASRGFSAMAAAPSAAPCAARVGVCQFEVTHDKETNIRTATQAIRSAAQQGARLVVLPEVWNGPYATAAFPEYAETCPSIGDDATSSASPSVKAIAALAAELRVFIIGGSIAEVDADGRVFNTCLVYDPQGTVRAKVGYRRAGSRPRARRSLTRAPRARPPAAARAAHRGRRRPQHRKVHLFDIDVPGKITFKESDTLSAGSAPSVFDASSIGVGPVGVGICYDVRFPELSLLMQQQGARLLVFPGAFNLVTGPAHWELLMRARAVDAQAYVIGASPARVPAPDSPTGSKYPHYTAYGYSLVVNPWGEVVAGAKEGAEVLVLDLEMGKVDEVRAGIPTSAQKRPDVYRVGPAPAA